MTRVEHLLTIVAEECAEVAQECSKALRFGLNDIKPGQDLTNAERIAQEYTDLVAALILLSRENGGTKIECLKNGLEAKRLKIEKYLSYSAEVGCLVEKA